MIADLIGLPRADGHVFQIWSDGIAAGMVLSTHAPEALDGLKEAHCCQNELITYFGELIARRRRKPEDDLLTSLVQAEESGSILNNRELIAMCVLLLFAGHETTRHLIGNGALALLQHPSECERLRAEPGLIGRAVEEFLRYDSPVHATARRATADMEIRGYRIQTGEFLTPVIGAANRDPAQFAHPDTLDIGRADNRHLAFAHGAHFCLGAPLSRLEGELAIGTLLKIFSELEFAGTPVRRRHFYLRGLESLPVTGVAC